MYDIAIFHTKEFTRRDIKSRQVVHQPSIDPLSPKNDAMSEAKIKRVLKKYGIDRSKPIITQISRFDKWKDPKGVIDAYRLVKREVKCQLVLLGSFATDDPEGEAIYRELVKYDQEDKDIHVIGIKDDNLVNALQRVSSVVVQKSLREGFGLTVSEALYKGTPVVAGNVGGIRLQIRNGWNEYLIDPTDIKICASRIKKIMTNTRLRERMGRNGRNHVRKNFLVTAHIRDWVNLLSGILK